MYETLCITVKLYNHPSDFGPIDISKVVQIYPLNLVIEAYLREGGG